MCLKKGEAAFECYMFRSCNSRNGAGDACKKYHIVSIQYQIYQLCTYSLWTFMDLDVLKGFERSCCSSHMLLEWLERCSISPKLWFWMGKYFRIAASRLQDDEQKRQASNFCGMVWCNTCSRNDLMANSLLRWVCNAEACERPRFNETCWLEIWIQARMCLNLLHALLLILHNL